MSGGGRVHPEDGHHEQISRPDVTVHWGRGSGYFAVRCHDGGLFQKRPPTPTMSVMLHLKNGFSGLLQNQGLRLVLKAGLSQALQKIIHDDGCHVAM